MWKTLLILLLIATLARFWIVGTAKVLVNTQSSDGDESAYLQLGLDLREEGVLTDGTRPPLYPLLLVSFAERAWAYFTNAKLLTLGLGALTVTTAFGIGWRMFSLETGLLAAFFLAANREFHLRAATIYADTLMVLMFTTAWYFLALSLTDREPIAARRRFGALGWAGVFCGLAYLTKGSAPLLLGAWGLTALLHYRRQVLSRWELLLVPALFLVVSSPLLAYNQREFGSLFYNFATTHAMWMDRWAESQTADPAALPTFTSYLQTHTLSDVAARLQKGANRLHPTLAETLIPSRSWKPAWLGWALLLASLGTMGYLAAFQRAGLRAYYRSRRRLLQLSFFLLTSFYFFSLWYAAVLMESRFLLPILGPVYLLLADAVITIAGRAGKRAAAHPGGRWLYRATAVGVVVWAGWWLIHTTTLDRWSLSVDPYASDREANAPADAIRLWLLADRPAGKVRVIFGPSKSLPLWYFPRRFNFERLAVEMDSWPVLADFMQQTQPDYVIIDADTARRRRTALAPYFGYNEERDWAEIKAIPPGWALAHLDSHPCRWCIFRPFPQPSVAVPANLANMVELLGGDIDLRPDPSRPGQLLQATLYWRTLTAPAQDYTLFLHITAPDGFVRAQQDQQPFDGLWPTGQWQAGDYFATRFTIPLTDHVVGEHLLLAGMYNLETGERLPLVSGPGGPSPNAVLLGSVTLSR